MNESKAEAERMTNKNGKADADRFSIVADQIKTAATQFRTGRIEPAADSGSVALNQALAETQAVNGGTPPQAASAELNDPPITIPRANGLNGDHGRLGATGPIDLVSAVDDGSSDRRSARAAGTIINLPSAAVETPILRPANGSRPIVGSAGARVKEPASKPIGEAFPERRDGDDASNDVPHIGEEPPPTLGMFLLARRERRGVKREDAARATRIPLHYLRMLESNDYTMIADQLYLLPFLRRYADYLGLDCEEIAIRFVREVQRAENGPAPAPASRGISGNNDSAPSNRWAIIGAIAVIAIIAAWIILQRSHAPADAASAIQAQTAIQDADSPDSIRQALPPAATLPSAAPLANPAIAAPAPVLPSRTSSRRTDNNDPVPPGGTE